MSQMFNELVQKISTVQEANNPETSKNPKIVKESCTDNCKCDKEVDAKKTEVVEDVAVEESVEKPDFVAPVDVILAMKEGIISPVATPPGQRVILQDYDAPGLAESTPPKKYNVVVISEGKIPDWEDPDEDKMIDTLMEGIDFIDIQTVSNTAEDTNTTHFSVSDKDPTKLFVSGGLEHGTQISFDSVNAQKLIDFLQQFVTNEEGMDVEDDVITDEPSPEM